MNPTHRKINNARLLLQIAEHRTAPFIDQLNSLNADMDGYPTATFSTGPRGGQRTINIPDENGNPDHVPITSVEATVLDRNRRPTSPSRLLDDLDSIATALLNLAHQLDAITSINTNPIDEVTLRRMQCTQCTKIADPSKSDGLCLDCRKSHLEQRARIEQNRRTRRHQGNAS